MGLDSYDLVLSVEQHFGVDLPDEKLAQVKSVGHLARLVEAELHDVGVPVPPDKFRVLLEVIRITAEHNGVAVDRVRSDTRFVEDLGMD